MECGWWKWGETTTLDDKGRITIPAEIGRAVGKRAFEVELAGKDTIVLRAFEDRRSLVKKVVGVKLAGDKQRSSVDAATIKDFHGGINH